MSQDKLAAKVDGDERRLREGWQSWLNHVKTSGEDCSDDYYVAVSCRILYCMEESM
jgi:hypothetical protein